MVQKNLGILHEGLRTKKSTDPIYDRLISYRTYFMKPTMRKCTGKETAKIKDHSKWLEIIFKD